ncbi:MAG: ribosome assembly RNA-binding protein YhbY, partial [Enterocloster clostridioformis]|nr:ribosome assembly RNA-binding protein YhbY [Enterocloster clostridioformis]
DSTHSQVVQVIGRKIVLYRPAKEEKKRKIVLPEK